LIIIYYIELSNLIHFNQGERMDLREQFEKETGTRWINSQNEPDIEYVIWLEVKLNGVMEALKPSYYMGSANKD
jgi:hypothetical protein